MALKLFLKSSVATDGKDGNGLKLEKIGPIFSSFDAVYSKITKKILWLALPDKIHLISASS